MAQGYKPAKNDHIYHILCFCVCVQETWYNRIRNVTHDDRLLIKKKINKKYSNQQRLISLRDVQY